MVEIDWRSVYATVQGRDLVILADEFSSCTDQMPQCGLYNRSPGFGRGKIGRFSSSVLEGALRFAPSIHPNTGS